MRVVLLTSSFLPQVGGMEYVVHYLAEALLDLGVDVIVMARRQPKRDNFSHRYPLVRYGLPFKGGNRTGIDHATARHKLAQVYGRKHIDVVNIHGVAIAPRLVLPVLQRLDIPIVMTPHGEDVQKIPEIGYGLRLQPRWDRLVKQHLAAADVVTAISDAVRDEIDFLDQCRIVDIPNGIHTRLFGRERCHHLHDTFGLPRNSHFIVSVGRNHPKKGYEHGIRAVASLFGRQESDGWFYVLVGHGISAMTPLIRQLSMTSRIFLVENLTPQELKKCYNSCDIFFSPAIVEGLSLVSIEAMACGLPAVVTDVPGNRDIVARNRSGLTVRCMDIEDMANGLHQLITDEQLRASLGQTAYSRSGDYDWSRIAERYLAAYQRALHLHRREHTS